MVTVVPSSVNSPAAGAWANTVPGATAPFSCMTTCTKKPALIKALRASVSLNPTTLGTGALPFETVMLTKVPMSTTVLGAMSCSMTVPEGLSLSIGVTLPKTSFTFSSSIFAASRDMSPTRSGTPV